MTSFFHKKIFFCRLLSCRHCKSATILHCDLEGKVTKQKSQKRLSMSQKWCNISEQNTNGVMAQLVARLNGIQKVRGSNPLGSTTKIPYILYGIFCLFPRWLREFRKIRATAMPCEPLRADAYAITEASKVHFLRIPLAPPLGNNTNPETKTEFVLFFSNEHFGMIIRRWILKHMPGV